MKLFDLYLGDTLIGSYSTVEAALDAALAWLAAHGCEAEAA